MQCVADIHDQPANRLEAHPKRENLCNIILKCTCVYLQYPREVEQLYSCNQNLLDLVLEAFQLVALLQDLQSGGGGALKGLGSLGL